MPDRQDVPVVADVEEGLARTLVDLAHQVREQVEPVEVDLEGLLSGRVPLEQPLPDRRLAGGSEQGREPVLVGHDPVEHAPGGDLPGPSYEGGDAPGPLPIGVLLGPERGDPGVRPAVEVRAVVGRVHHDRVLGDPELVELREHPPDVLVVGDHYVVVEPLPALAPVLLGAVGPEVHGRGVVPDKERFAILVRPVDEVERVPGHLLVDGLHAFDGQRAGVLDPLAPPAVGPGVEDAPRAEPLPEGRVNGIILVLGLFLGVEVVEVAEELVEAVRGGKELVLVAEVVLAELAGGVPERFQQLRDGRVLGLEPDVGAGHPDLGQAGPDRVLARDERGAPGRAALLAVVVGEGDPLVRDAVDVGRPVAHLAPVVVADVPPADVVAPQDQDVWPLGCHAPLQIGTSLRRCNL